MIHPFDYSFQEKAPVHISTTVALRSARPNVMEAIITLILLAHTGCFVGNLIFHHLAAQSESHHSL